VDDHSTTGILDEFQTDLVDSWRRLPNKGFFFGLLLAWLALFQVVGNSTFGYLDTPSLLKWIFLLGSAHSAEGETDDNQMLIAPLVVIGLFWWKRKELLNQPMRLWWPGLLLVGLGLMLHIAGYRIQQPRVSIVALFVGVYGLMALAWGPKLVRASVFPFFLFMFCVPVGRQAQMITVPLRILVARIVEWIAKVFHMGVLRQGTQLIDAQGHFQYEVAAACGGIRSLVVITMVAIVVGFVTVRSVPKRLVLIALAAPLAVAGNVIRLMLIIIAAKIWGQDAGLYVHDGGPGGIIVLIPYMLALFVLMWVAARMSKNPRQDKTPALAEVAA
jgi:exosortase